MNVSRAASSSDALDWAYNAYQNHNEENIRYDSCQYEVGELFAVGNSPGNIPTVNYSNNRF